MAFSPEIFGRILARIATGESLRRVCQSEGFPSRETFFGWVRDDPEKRTAYIDACAIRELAYVEQFPDILEDLGDEPTNAQVNLAKLKIDTIKWTAARLQPKVYGDRIATHDGPPEVEIKDFSGKQPYVPGNAKEARSTVKS